MKTRSVKTQILFCFFLYQIRLIFYQRQSISWTTTQPVMNYSAKNLTDDHLDHSTQKNFEYSHRMELEGQCTIQHLQFLKVNYLKAIICTFLLTCTFFGLLALKYSKKLRTYAWFFEADSETATHVYVKHNKDVDDIEKIYREDKGMFFFFKKLKYAYSNKHHYPVGFDIEEKFSDYFYRTHQERGLTKQQLKSHQSIYQRNEHPVQIDNYFEYLLDVLVKPFFILQYIVCVAFIVEKIQVFAYCILGFSILTTSINYIISYLGFLKVKAMAEKQFQVNVIREGKKVRLSNFDLVPGDVIDPEGEIPCDCIVMKGDIYVNEASLTGEDIPIAKFAASSKQQIKLQNRWLFEGGKVLEKKNDICYALVVNVGFTTKRGKIIRKIRTKTSRVSQIFKRAMLFLVQVFTVDLIVYLATINVLLIRNIDPLFVGFRFIDFLGWSFPPIYPIYFNLIYSFALVRLKMHKVIGIEPEKTVDASSLKIMCFDKTGTLTKNQISVHDVFRIDEAGAILNITQTKNDHTNETIMKIFATCHTTKQIEGKFMGDEVDLRMYLFSGYEMVKSHKEDVRFIATHKQKGIELEVLRINQFQSKFQSMSVLVRDVKTDKYYAFVKGAPEKIQSGSRRKVQGMEEKIKKLSLRGLRTIGFGYREISKKNLDKYLKGERDIFNENLEYAGLVAFQNLLKEDTKELIDKLIYSDIEPKVITGDNIFIAIETATVAGIINQSDPVIILEGKSQKNQIASDEKRKFKGRLLRRVKGQAFEEEIILTERQNYQNQEYPIAIDNDFLKLDPMPILVSNIRIFARVPPQNKALIIDKEKQKIRLQYQSRSFCSKLFGKLKMKVGMCGDGANDLMAIRQADVGIGINDSDASYGATFTIKDMLDVDYLIRDSKATNANIIEIFRYFAIISIMKIPSTILMIADTSYWNFMQIMFFNFTTTVIFPIVQALSRPTNKSTPMRPETNLFGVINHLRIWLSEIVIAGGLIAGFFYFVNTDEFIPNTRPSAKLGEGWNPMTHSATIIFLMIQIPFTFYVIFVYISQPWKKRIYRNYLLSFLILANIGQSIALFFITPNLVNVFYVVPISPTTAAICLSIISLATLISYIINAVIDLVEFKEK